MRLIIASSDTKTPRVFIIFPLRLLKSGALELSRRRKEQRNMNYFGGKSRIAKYIVPYIQHYIDSYNIDTYIEPFCGGLNVIDKIDCKKKYANDLNKYLIALFQHVSEGGKLPEEVTKEKYDEARQAWYKDNADHKFEDWEIGCIGQLCSYGGRNFDGGWSYEVDERLKDGTIKHRNYYQERKRNLLKQFENPLLKNVVFSTKDYMKLNENKVVNCVIYCDPPYQSAKSFANSKTINYDEFWNKMRNLSEHNIVLISELEAPNDFECMWNQEVNRSIKESSKGRATEKLFKWKG